MVVIILPHDLSWTASFDKAPCPSSCCHHLYLHSNTLHTEGTIWLLNCNIRHMHWRKICHQLWVLTLSLISCATSNELLNSLSLSSLILKGCWKDENVYLMYIQHWTGVQEFPFSSPCIEAYNLTHCVGLKNLTHNHTYTHNLETKYSLWYSQQNLAQTGQRRDWGHQHAGPDCTWSKPT